MKVDDWVFFEAKLCLVQDVRNGQVTQVSDGWFNTSGNFLTDRCFPLNLHNKVWSEEFGNLLDKMPYGRPGTNIPGIKWRIISEWITCMNADNDEDRRSSYDRAKKFLEDVNNAVDQVEIDGVKLFR